MNSPDINSLVKCYNEKCIKEVKKRKKIRDKWYATFCAATCALVPLAIAAGVALSRGGTRRRLPSDCPPAVGHDASHIKGRVVYLAGAD